MSHPTTIKFRESELVSVPLVEQKYNAVFVGDFCAKGKYGWMESVAALFWQEKPPVEGYSNYFALVVYNGDLYITSGQQIADQPIAAVVAKDGEIVYSRHRHDCRTSKDGSVTVDGGRDYLRLVGDYSIHAKRVTLKIVGPSIEVHEVERSND